MAEDVSFRPDNKLSGLRLDPAMRQPHGRGVLWWIVLAMGLAVLIGSASFWLYQKTLGRPPQVQVAFARLVGADAQSVGAVLSGAGYIVTGDRYISIGVRVPGRIDAYEAQEGDFVHKGDILVRLDDRDYQAALKKVEANLALAKANLVLKQKQEDRMRELYTRGLVAAQELDVAENALAVAQAEVHQAEADVLSARVNLDYTRLTSPTDGIVLAKLKEVGEIAVPGGFAGAGDLLRIANLNDVRAEVDINEVDFRRVRMAQQVEVVPDAYPDRTYPAQVVKIYPQANRQKGTLKVEAKLAKVDEYLRPDMSVRLNFLADAPKTDGAPRIVAPRSAVRGDGEQTFVWTIRNGQAYRTSVRTGEDFGDSVQITDGLEGGEALIVAGPDSLQDGMPVETLSSNAPR
ncbi:MAG: efflux RND transporter periplasmic adaptor subunit [Candidatus Binatia bacterium]